MIDQDKMRALAKRLNWIARQEAYGFNKDDYREAADAIDLLLEEVEAANLKYKEAILDAEKAREERNRTHVKLNAEWIEKTNAFRADLEVAATVKHDALNQAASMAEVYLADHGIEQVRECLPDAIRALAQRQEEGS